MNIITATEKYNQAKQQAAAGQHLEAARSFLTAQDWARKCRSAKRADLAFYAHTGASIQASKVLEISTDHSDRSEAGRIRAESMFLFQKGL
jgi:hypothetical protein